MPTESGTPQRAHNAGLNDYGYGTCDYGNGAAATPTSGQGATAAEQSTVGTPTSSLGMILVDGLGHTLCALTMDSPGVGTCEGN
jgi:hypothetical protein